MFSKAPDERTEEDFRTASPFLYSIEIFKTQLSKYQGRASRLCVTLELNYAMTMYRNLFYHFEIFALDKNLPLFYYKDKGDKFYAIVDGEVKVCVPKPQEQIDEIINIPYEDVGFILTIEEYL